MFAKYMTSLVRLDCIGLLLHLLVHVRKGPIGVWCLVPGLVLLALVVMELLPLVLDLTPPTCLSRRTSPSALLQLASSSATELSSIP